MWTTLLTNKEMIRSMFPDGFDLGLPELSSVLISEDDIKLSMNVRDIPKSYPKKWNSEEFNAIHLVFEFGEVEEFLASGTNPSWLDNVSIQGNSKKVSIVTNSGSFTLKMSSKFITVRNITPYIDVRW